MLNSPVWVLGEVDKNGFSPVTYGVITRAALLADKLAAPLEVVAVCGEISEEQLREPIYRGGVRVLAIISPQLENATLETKANLLADAAREREPQIILAAATTSGRVLMPSLAARLETGLTADCTGLDIDQDRNMLQTRPAVGGNIMASISTMYHRAQMATVRPYSTPEAQRDPGRTGEIVRLPFKRELVDNRAKILSKRSRRGEGSDIQAARVIVAGGRGMKKKENFTLLEKTAEILHGAVGASRDAVDRGWAEYPRQIGLSGKTVVPKLYIAAGISGTIQHLAGMKTAETIVAINRDPDAQIFKAADFGIVGDLFEILPILNKRLKRETGL